ncbi:SHOCT domain-containing protein [Flexistipes sp.]|uniref:SHOCT domain-containing protein n=1 Tax=Flexistipes sp. TaxID=3088135 RepID=UPI002E1D92B9|nr:SHOCT domain-containing protein [Flexistipes sp.]
MHGYNGYGFGMGYGMGFGWIIWIIVIILLIFLLVKVFGSQNNSTGRDENRALEILKERYAKGEIDKQEFEEKKKDLK